MSFHETKKPEVAASVFLLVSIIEVSHNHFHAHILVHDNQKVNDSSNIYIFDWPLWCKDISCYEMSLFTFIFSTIFSHIYIKSYGKSIYKVILCYSI